MHTHNLHVQRREHCGVGVADEYAVLAIFLEARHKDVFLWTRYGDSGSSYYTLASHHDSERKDKDGGNRLLMLCMYKHVRTHAYLCALGRMLWCVASILHA